MAAARLPGLAGLPWVVKPPGAGCGWLPPAVHCIHRSSRTGTRPGNHQSPAAAKAQDTSPSADAAAAHQRPYYVGEIKRSSSSGSGGIGINKEPISSNMSPALYAWMLEHTREHPLLAELRHETSAMHGAQMQVAPEQGALLALLVELLGVSRAIEVGVFTGYSSLAVALALPPGGCLFAFDRDAQAMAVAQRYWERAGVAANVVPRLGPAVQGLQQLLAEAGEGSFDMAFIDADKRGYQSYFELCLRLVRPGGLIAVDNVLFYGRVADPAAADKASLALKAFGDGLLADERVSFSIVPIGDGMALCRKR